MSRRVLSLAPVHRGKGVRALCVGLSHSYARWLRSNRIRNLSILPDEWRNGVAVNYVRNGVKP